jgi:L-malate glycosyltransferase
MKKILVTATTFPRWKNDTTARFVYDLSERLASKHQIYVLSPHHKNAKKSETIGRMFVTRFAYFWPEGMQKLCYNGGIIPNMGKSLLAKLQLPFLITSEFFALRSIIKRERIELIHAHWILPQGLIASFHKKIIRIPLLVTVHGSDLFPLKNPLYKKLQKFSLKNADFVTVNSEATRKELMQRFPDYSKKIRVVPMGVNIDTFKKRNIKKPKKYSKNRILLTVGRLSDQKGLQYLLAAMDQIKSYDPKVKLLVIGEGPYEKELLKIVRSRNLRGNVEFLGSKSALEISKYYNYADIFILPSLSNRTGTEALGLSLLEAMASGCAVIGTDVGGITFIIKNGHNGILVRERNSQDLATAIIDLLKNKKKSRKLGKNAMIFVREGYSWDTVSKEFEKIYASLLK